MSAARAWVRLGSGRRVDLLDPSPLDWDDEDLAVGLARTYRWGGHSIWDLPLSVAQHSLTVLAIRKQHAREVLTATGELHELLHDAEEGLLGFDPISPVKPRLGPGYQAISDRLQQTIALRYRLRRWSPERYAQHKHADRLAAASEAIHVAGWSAAELRALGIRLKPLTDDPLFGLGGFAPWEPWPPKVAATRFLDRLAALSAKQRLEEPNGLAAGVPPGPWQPELLMIPHARVRAPATASI